MVRKINEINNKYGKLKVISEAPSTGRGARWLCKCTCGNKTVVLGIDLRSGNTSSCGCNYIIEEIGKRYGKYTVIEKGDAGERVSNSTHWKCRCECGKVKVVRGDILRRGEAKSCGQCYLPKLLDKEGYSDHCLYHTWSNMMKRCYNANTPAFKDYGGRGVKVYKLWHSPDKFYTWIEKNLGQRPNNFSLDRINVYGDYEPGNLQWASPYEQVNNRRLVLLTEEEHQLVLQLRKKANKR